MFCDAKTSIHKTYFANAFYILRHQINERIIDFSLCLFDFIVKQKTQNVNTLCNILFRYKILFYCLTIFYIYIILFVWKKDYATKLFL